MIEHKTVIQQIVVDIDGTVGVKIALLLADGPREVDRKWHRTSVAPDAEVAAQMMLVNEHLAQMGRLPVSAADIEKINNVVKSIRS